MIGIAIYLVMVFCVIDKISIFENIEIKITAKYFEKNYIKRVQYLAKLTN